MKKSYKILITTELISILILLLLIHLSINIYYIIAFIFLKLLLLVKYFGIEKKNDRYQKENMLNILIIIFAYYLVTYLIGIFVGFVQSSYILKFKSIIQNVFPILMIILLSELLRYEYTTKGKQCKTVIGLAVFFFILIDISVGIREDSLKNLQAIIIFIASIGIPAIAKNIMLTYQSYHTNYKMPILYRCLMELPVYILPIVPDLGIYVDSSIKTMIPAIILYFSYELYRNKEKKEKIQKTKRYDLVFYLIIAFLSFIVVMTSGLFKYYALAVGSGSMTPNINKGDAVIVKKLDKEEIKQIEVGDVLVFKNNGITIVHRVVQINKITEDKYYFYTKGDNNNGYDGYPISIENIIGVAKGRIRWIGYPTVILNEILQSRWEFSERKETKESRRTKKESTRGF